MSHAEKPLEIKAKHLPHEVKRQPGPLLPMASLCHPACHRHLVLPTDIWHLIAIVKVSDLAHSDTAALFKL